MVSGARHRCPAQRLPTTIVLVKHNSLRIPYLIMLAYSCHIYDVFATHSTVVIRRFYDTKPNACLSTSKEQSIYSVHRRVLALSESFPPRNILTWTWSFNRALLPPGPAALTPRSIWKRSQAITRNIIRDVLPRSLRAALTHTPTCNMFHPSIRLHLLQTSHTKPRERHPDTGMLGCRQPHKFGLVASH